MSIKNVIVVTWTSNHFLILLPICQTFSIQYKRMKIFRFSIQTISAIWEALLWKIISGQYKLKEE